MRKEEMEKRRKKSYVQFTCHIVRRDPARILPGCCGYWGRIRIATAAPPLPCGHTVPRSATLSRCPSSAIIQSRYFELTDTLRFDSRHQCVPIRNSYSDVKLLSTRKKQNKKASVFTEISDEILRT